MAFKLLLFVFPGLPGLIPVYLSVAMRCLRFKVEREGKANAQKKKERKEREGRKKCTIQKRGRQRKKEEQRYCEIARLSSVRIISEASLSLIIRRSYLSQQFYCNFVIGERSRSPRSRTARSGRFFSFSCGPGKCRFNNPVLRVTMPACKKLWPRDNVPREHSAELLRSPPSPIEITVRKSFAGGTGCPPCPALLQHRKLDTERAYFPQFYIIKYLSDKLSRFSRTINLDRSTASRI